jgi:hypothetical protein
MRTFLAFVVIAGLGLLYAWQKRHEITPVAQQESLTHAVSSTPAKPTMPTLASTPVREVSEHNWMKRSLDRARDVRDEARTRTKEGQNP